MGKLCLPLGFVLAVMISSDANNCLGGDCKAFGASSMLQSKASKAATAKKHYAEYVRPPANSSLVAKGMDHAMREQRHEGFDQVFVTDEHDSFVDARGHYEKRNASVSTASQLARRRATSNLIGQPAPDFELEFKKEGKMSLHALVKEKGLPTVVEFYQNYWHVCGEAAQHLDALAAEPKYKDKVNFVLVNMKTLEDVEQFKIDHQLGGNTLHGISNFHGIGPEGQLPPAYGLDIIPHKILIDGNGIIVKNGNNVVSLPADLDELLARPVLPLRQI